MKFNRIIALLLLLIAVITLSNKVFAAQKNTIYFSIEGYDKTIVSTTLKGNYTIRTALEKISTDNKLKVVYNIDNGNTEIFSVSGIENNKFDKNDCWKFIIIRNNAIVENVDFKNTSLQNHDKVLIYYGLDGYTQIATDISFTEAGNLLNISVSSKYYENGNLITKPLENAKIFVTSPINTSRILVSNNSGKAVTKLENPGVYKFIIKDEQTKNVPSIVKSEQVSYIYGVKNKNAVSRAESVSFIVNEFNISENNGSIYFMDVSDNHPYINQIKSAFNKGIVKGFEDGNFKPDDKINFLQFTVMLSGVLDDNKTIVITEEIKKLPSWSRQKIARVLQTNILDNINLAWNDVVTVQDLNKIAVSINYLKYN